MLDLLKTYISERLPPNGKCFVDVRKAIRYFAYDCRSRVTRFDLFWSITKYVITYRLTEFLFARWFKDGNVIYLKIKDPFKYFVNFKIFNFYFSDDYPYDFMGGVYCGIDDIIYYNKFMQGCLGRLYKPGRFVEGPYEIDEVQINKGDIVIDAGSNIGVFTLAALVRGAAKVYAFDPQDVCYRYTLNNIDGNGYRYRGKVFKYGLSVIDGPVDLMVKDCHVEELRTPDASSSICRADGEKCTAITIECITLDTFVKQHNIERIDFIKADIEGAERLMLEGARDTIKRFHPKLTICTYHLPDDPEVIEKIVLDIDPTYKILHTSHKMFAW